ncbi:response regulator [Colwelliaceae bacterium 6471]
MLKERKIGLQGKISLGIALMIILSLAVTSHLSFTQSKKLAERQVIELEASKLAVLKHSIENSLRGHQDILLSLRDVPPVQAILRARLNNGIDPESSDSLEEWQRRLEVIFSAFLINQSQYLQIRYIDSAGHEMVRVDSDKSGSPLVMSSSQLQNKSGADYVEKTLKLALNQVFYSDVSLNREYGEIQIPYQPVLRIATPIYSHDGDVQGLIVINLKTDLLFGEVSASRNGAIQYLVDHKGNYLVHDDVTKTFAQEKGLSVNFNLEQPILSSYISSHEKLIKNFYQLEQIAGFEKIYFSPTDKRYWLLTMQVPTEVLFADISASLYNVLLVGVVIGLLSLLVVIWFVSNRVIKPVVNLASFAEQLKEGDLSIRLDPTKVHDEIRTLYEVINMFTIAQQFSTNDLKLKIDGQARRLSAVIEHVIDGIVTIDEKGKIVTFNRAAQTIFGYTESEVIGKNAKMLMPESYHSDYERYLLKHITADEKKTIGIGHEVVGQRKNGAVFPMELAVSEVNIDNVRHFIGITRDITERKRIELMQKEFISTVSHELRTPLTSISGSLGLVLGGIAGELPARAKELLTIANNNSERLIHLINDILDIEKISAGKMQFNFSVVSLIPLIEKSLEENKSYGEQYNVDFKFQAEIDNEVMVRVDEKRMQQVMANLLSNAVKYSPSGEDVTITVSLDKGLVRIAVHDNGQGIPQSFKSKIFTKFSQADSSDTRQKGGTGLGLNITKAIVSRHQGTINFVSEEGQGTTFYVDLPLWREKKVANVHLKKNDDNKPTILIVEDDLDVSNLLSNMLENNGFQFDQAYDYDEALLKIKTNDYDAVTLDLILPGGCGIGLLRELRSDDKTSELPVVVVSAVVDKGRKELSGDAIKMVDWIEKPIDTDRLIVTIESALSDNRKMPARILHVEDDLDIAELVASYLGGKFEVLNAATLMQAQKLLDSREFDLVLLDIGLPDGSGLDLLPMLSINERKIPVVIFSAQEVPDDLASEVMATLVKSKTDKAQLIEQIKSAIYKNI